MSVGCVDGKVGVTRPGFVAKLDGEIIASAETLEELAEKEPVKNLLGYDYFIIEHVVPEGVVKVFSQKSGRATPAKKGRYFFGVYAGDDLKKVVEKHAFSAQNVSFEKTQDLADLCLGILCNLVAGGFPLDSKDIVKIWKTVNGPCPR